jgi:hypothetical protein
MWSIESQLSVMFQRNNERMSEWVSERGMTDGRGISRSGSLVKRQQSKISSVVVSKARTVVVVWPVIVVCTRLVMKRFTDINLGIPLSSWWVFGEGQRRSQSGPSSAWAMKSEAYLHCPACKHSSSRRLCGSLQGAHSGLLP